MRYGIFFNPNAGNGNAEKLAKKMQEKFKQAGHEGEFLTAPDPEKAVETVKEAIEEYDGIVAIGGDGSLNIVGTAFVQAGKSIPLGIIPGGTINNFAKRWHLPMDEEEAMDIIIAGYQRKVGMQPIKIGKKLLSALLLSDRLRIFPMRFDRAKKRNSV